MGGMIKITENKIQITASAATGITLLKIRCNAGKTH